MHLGIWVTLLWSLSQKLTSRVGHETSETTNKIRRNKLIKYRNIVLHMTLPDSCY